MEIKLKTIIAVWRYIKNPNKIIKLAAIKQNGCAIKFIKNPDIQLQKIAINNINNNDVEWFINNCIKKIKDSILLNELYSKAKSFKSKNKIKKSKYWKDDANLILEIINLNN